VFCLPLPFLAEACSPPSTFLARSKTTDTRSLPELGRPRFKHRGQLRVLFPPRKTSLFSTKGGFRPPPSELTWVLPRTFFFAFLRGLSSLRTSFLGHLTGHCFTRRSFSRRRFTSFFFSVDLRLSLVTRRASRPPSFFSLLRGIFVLLRKILPVTGHERLSPFSTLSRGSVYPPPGAPVSPWIRGPFDFFPFSPGRRIQNRAVLFFPSRSPRPCSVVSRSFQRNAVMIMCDHPSPSPFSASPKFDSRHSSFSLRFTSAWMSHSL